MYVCILFLSISLSIIYFIFGDLDSCVALAYLELYVYHAGL